MPADIDLITFGCSRSGSTVSLDQVTKKCDSTVSLDHVTKKCDSTVSFDHVTK